MQITLSAMFVALGILLPIIFHTVGLGRAFLPIFWSLAAAAFFLNWPAIIAVAVLTPLLSSLMTGMPPISPPIMQIIMLEMITLGTTAFFFYKTLGFKILWSLLLGLILSRIVLALLIAFLAPYLGLPSQLFSTTTLIEGMPGVVTILVVVPIVVSRIKGETVI